MIKRSLEERHQAIVLNRDDVREIQGALASRAHVFRQKLDEETGEEADRIAQGYERFPGYYRVVPEALDALYAYLNEKTKPFLLSSDIQKMADTAWENTVQIETQSGHYDETRVLDSVYYGELDVALDGVLQAKEAPSQYKFW